MWLLVRKQEMTRIWVEDKLVPVTFVAVPPQLVQRHKTVENDWYSALVVSFVLPKKSIQSSPSLEIPCDEGVLSSMVPWTSCSIASLDGVVDVRVSWVSKWKWFQWWMKRHNFGWWPATHWSKFHRALWSTGNRKPRRTIKGQKMAWRMWGEVITLKTVPVLGLYNIDGVELIALKGSIPWAYNDFIKLYVA